MKIRIITLLIGIACSCNTFAGSVDFIKGYFSKGSFSERELLVLENIIYPDMLKKGLAFDSIMPVKLKKVKRLDKETCATVNGYYVHQEKSLGFCQIKTDGEILDLYHNANTLYHELGHAVSFKKYEALSKPASKTLPDGSKYYRTALNEGVATLIAFLGIQEYLQDYIDRNNLSYAGQKITPLQLYCLDGESLKKYFPGMSTPFLSSSYRKYFKAMLDEIATDKGNYNIAAKDFWNLLDKNSKDDFDALSERLQKKAGISDYEFQIWLYKQRAKQKDISNQEVGELLPSSDLHMENHKVAPVSLDKIQIHR